MHAAEISLNTRTITFLLGIATAICALVQISLGANLLILSLALLSITCGLYGFWVFGMHSLPGMLALIYLCGTFLIAFFAKTVLGQTVESYLYTPSQSFLVFFVCCLSLLAAMIAAEWINVGKPLEPIRDLGTLRFIAIIAFIVGLAISFFHSYVDRGLQGPEYGGLAMFKYLIYLGIISQTAYVMLRSRMQRHLDAVLLIMLILATGAGVMENGRGETAMPCIIFFITIFFFRRSLPWRYVVTLICSTLLFVAIAPLILVFRYSGFRNMTFSQEIAAFENTLPLLLNSDRFSFEAGKFSSVKGYYYNYFGNGKRQVVLGRLASIQQIDPAIAATDASRPMGSDIMISALRFLIPRAIDPNKPKDPNSFVILKHQGWTSEAHGKYPTLPMAGEIYSAYGMTGVLIFTFPVFLLNLLAYKKVGWSLDGNVVSIFFLVSYVWSFYAGSLEVLIGSVCRDLPAYLLIIFGLQRLYLFLTQQKRFGRFVQVTHQA